MSKYEFIPGVQLARRLANALEPGLREMISGLPITLAFIGPGSDVLGYDTARSMDHDWGPRLTVIVPEDACTDVAKRIDGELERLIPAAIAGFPTRFSLHADGATFSDAAGALHRIHVTSTQRVLRDLLLIDDLAGLDDAVWLSTPMQTLLEVTAGEVFVDDAGELTVLRAALAFYPEHILRYQLAALWMRVSQIQPFIGRSGEVGDEAGSAIIAASLGRDLMRIGLLQSGHYTPYAKWLGTAFARTAISAVAQPNLTAALHATSWQVREAALNRAGSQLVRQLNGLRLIPTLPESAVQFHSRPFRVLPAEEIAHRLQASLADTALSALTAFVGGIDVVTDSTDALKSGPFRVALRAMYTDSLQI